MKINILPIVLFCSFLSVFENLYGEGITISKGQNVPNDVCNVTSYAYTAALSGLDPNKTYYVSWKPTNASIEASSVSGATVKWQASTTLQTGNIGKIYAELQDVNKKPIATSNTIEVTIKSIKHLKAEIPMYTYNGGVLTIDPCSSGTIYMSAANMSVPGTGTFPESVVDFKWLVPSGWKVDGQTSNGSSVILAGQNVTVVYPASATEGTLSVKGYHVVLGCTAELQESVSSDAISVKRDANFSISANKSNLLCGETSPVTFTVTPALPCAVYYWNNSQTPSTSNSSQITPDGSTNVITTVNIVYGGKTKTMSKTINYLLFDPNNLPNIVGDDKICLGSNSSYYSVTCLRTGYSVTYEKSANLALSQTGNTCTLAANGNGMGWLKAKINTPCGEYPITLSKDVWVGIPSTPTNIVGFYEGQVFGFGSEPSFSVSTNSLQNVTGFEWVVIGGTITGGQGTNRITVLTNSVAGVFKVKVRLNNSCGTTTYFGRNGSLSEEGGGTLVISPNPTTSETTIELVSGDGKELVSNAIWDLEIYDSMQSMKTKVQKIKSNRQPISTSGWKDGVYIVRAKIGEKIISGKLVVKH